MAESQPTGQPPWWSRHWLTLTALGLGPIVLLAYSVLAVTVLPPWIVSVNAGPKADDNTRLNAIANTRGTLLGVLAPVVVAIGAVAAFLNYRETSAQNRRTVELSRDTLDVTRRGQLTERFTKAIEQLGQTAEDKLDIRLGGIYALEQIAKESAELHQPVMEILTAFLREHSRLQETSAKIADDGVSTTTQSDSASNERVASLRADFQGVATVLGRRQLGHDPDRFMLDLRGVALSRVYLAVAQLQKATFAESQLQEAVFVGAQLQQASFVLCDLEGAYFAGAELRKALFGYAHLKGADFRGAQLEGARFERADLRAARFERADLKGARFERADLKGVRFAEAGTNEEDALGLTLDQLRNALNVEQAVLPDYLAKARESRPGAGLAE